MKSALRLCSLVLLSLFIRVGAAAADNTPDGTIREILDKMKSEGSPAVIVDYVDWDKAFTQFPEKQKTQLGTKSAAELKDFFREMLAHPTDVMRKQMEAKLATVPPEHLEEAKQSMVRLEEMMKAKEAELHERLTNTKYELGKPVLEGDTATVKLTQTYKDQTKTEDVKLEKKGDHWMLPSVNLSQPKPADNAAAPQASATPAAAASASATPTPAAKGKKPAAVKKKK